MVLLLTVFVKIITARNFSYSANILGQFIICREGCTGFYAFEVLIPVRGFSMICLD